MDDFSKKFCNYEELRKQRSEIKTEIDHNLKNLVGKDKNISFNFRLEYKRLLESIRDYIDNHDEEVTYKKEANKLASLIEVYCYLSDIEYILTQIRLENNYIKNYEE